MNISSNSLPPSPICLRPYRFQKMGKRSKTKSAASILSPPIQERRMQKTIFLILTLLFCIPFSDLYAQSADYPIFIAQGPNPNDYSLFANGGWDGNWYV